MNYTSGTCMSSSTPGGKARPSVPVMSWQTPATPLLSELGVGPKSGHQAAGNLGKIIFIYDILSRFRD